MFDASYVGAVGAVCGASSDDLVSGVSACLTVCEVSELVDESPSSNVSVGACLAVWSGMCCRWFGVVVWVVAVASVWYGSELGRIWRSVCRRLPCLGRLLLL